MINIYIVLNLTKKKNRRLIYLLCKYIFDYMILDHLKNCIIMNIFYEGALSYGEEELQDLPRIWECHSHWAGMFLQTWLGFCPQTLCREMVQHQAWQVCALLKRFNWVLCANYHKLCDTWVQFLRINKILESVYMYSRVQISHRTQLLFH